MPEPTEVITISYSVKDILERLEAKIDSKFDMLAAGIASKAETSDVAKLTAAQGMLDDRVTDIERQLKDQKETRSWRSDWRRWLANTVLAAALTAVSIISLIHG